MQEAIEQIKDRKQDIIKVGSAVLGAALGVLVATFIEKQGSEDAVLDLEVE